MAERAVNYCRCSTEEESQRDALRVQTLESREWIHKMGWIHVDEYVEAKSGTQMKGRTEYQRLYEDMLSDKFDIIVIKDQDRLMRNTKDWYLFLDRMLQNEKRLYMYLENKWYSPDDALITGIRAILAEEYSRTLSKKINNAHRGRQEKGASIVMNSNTFGFIKKGRDKPVINPVEAEAINRMYDLSILGYGSTRISRKLWEEGYKDRNGEPYKATRIGRILRNPLYMGTAVMNRLHFDFDTKKLIKNPKEEWIIHKDLVPAIVTPEKWEKANQAMDIRRGKHKNTVIPMVNPGIPLLSGKIICGLCHVSYYRTTRKTKSGVIKEWTCAKYVEHGRKRTEDNQGIGCDNIHVSEEVLLKLLDDIREQYYNIKESNHIVEHMIHVLEKAMESPDQNSDTGSYEKQMERLLHQKDVLLNKLLDEVISDEDFQHKNEELNAAIDSLKDKMDKQKETETEVEEVQRRLQKIRHWLEHGGLEKATTADMIDDIKRITVDYEDLDIEILPKRLSELVKEESVHIKVKYPFPWTTKQGRILVEKKIVELWKERPSLTVKDIAEMLGVPYKSVLGRVEHLKESGVVRYNGKGGNGVWEILKNT